MSKGSELCGRVFRHSDLDILWDFVICHWGLRIPGSWRAPFRFLQMHWDHEPGWSAPPVRSPGFSRSKPFQPPKGGTPNQPRFMESPLSFFSACIGTMNQWRRGSRTGVSPVRFARAGCPCHYLSLHGEPPFVLRMHWEHEPDLNDQ